MLYFIFDWNEKENSIKMSGNFFLGHQKMDGNVEKLRKKIFVKSAVANFMD